MNDPVNKPSHYQIMLGVEVIDIREALLLKIPPGTPATEMDHWSRAWEYLTRMHGKNGLEDAKKARWYLDRLIQSMEGVTEVKPHQDDFEEWDKGESRIEQIGQNGGDGRHYVDLQPGQVWEKGYIRIGIIRVMTTEEGCVECIVSDVNSRNISIQSQFSLSRDYLLDNFKLVEFAHESI